MNNDVCTEILLHLPVESLLRFRAICKSWGHVIDSPSFRKRHIHNNNNTNKESNNQVYVEFYIHDGRIELRHKKKSLICYKSDQYKRIQFGDMNNEVSSYGPVMGLTCIYGTQLSRPIAICNPCLGQLKLLPPIPISYNRCPIIKREVAIGFDEDYKVVQLLACRKHRRLHGLLYSIEMDSWRELSGLISDLEVYMVEPMSTGCENGHFAHWHVLSRYCELILILDMKNEVFRRITLPSRPLRRVLDRKNEVYRNGLPTQEPRYSTKVSTYYFAEDEHSFWRFDLPHSRLNKVVIYRSSFERGPLNWNRVTSRPLYDVLPWRISTCVFLECRGKVFMFDYRDRTYYYRDRRCYYRDPVCGFPTSFKHRWSLVSLENES